MTSKSKSFEFTGKHMAGVLVAGFGIVIAVNFFMASLAIGGFHGVVVKNSYVASQKFNSWLDKAERSRALGWEATSAREKNGYVLVTSPNLPAGADIHAELRRPLGAHEFASLTFSPAGKGRYRSNAPVAAGRWTIRLRIEAGADVWTSESELQ